MSLEASSHTLSRDVDPVGGGSAVCSRWSF